MSDEKLHVIVAISACNRNHLSLGSDFQIHVVDFTLHLISVSIVFTY